MASHKAAIMAPRLCQAHEVTPWPLPTGTAEAAGRMQEMEGNASLWPGQPTREVALCGAA